MADLGDLILRLKVDSSEYERDLKRARSLAAGIDDITVNLDAQGIRNANRQLGQFSTTSRSAVQSFGTLQGVIAGASAAITQSLIQIGARLADIPRQIASISLGNFQQFDAQLQQFTALTGQSREQLTPLTDEIRRLGIETTKAPTEIAAAANELVTLGASANTVQDQLGGVVALSEATSVGLSEAARLSQLAANTFGFSAEETADKLTVLRNTTAASVGDVQQLIQQASGVFNSLGDSADPDELLTFFATLRDGGLNAEVAATGLRGVITTLVDPAKADELQKLGVSAFDAAGNFLGFEEILRQLQVTQGQFNPEDFTSLLVEAFGREVIPSISTGLALLDTKFAQTQTNLQSFEGAAAQASETLTQGFAGSLTLLSGSLETFTTSIGSALAPTVQGLVEGLTAVLNEALNTEGLFTNLTLAGENFLATLRESPTIVRDLSDAFVQVISLIADDLARNIQEITQFLRNNPNAVREFADRLVEATQFTLQLKAGIEAIVLALGQLGGGVFNNIFEGLENSQQLIAAIADRDLPQILNNVQQLIGNFRALNPVIGLAFSPIEGGINLFLRFVNLVNAALSRLGLDPILVEQLEATAGGSLASSLTNAADAMGTLADESKNIETENLQTVEDSGNTGASNATQPTRDLQAEEEQREKDLQELKLKNQREIAEAKRRQDEAELAREQEFEQQKLQRERQFEDEQRARKLALEDEILAKKRDTEQQIEAIKEAGRQAEEEFQDRQRQKEEDFNARQQAEREAFEDDLAARRQQAERDFALSEASSLDERNRLVEQFAQQDRRAEALAPFEEEQAAFEEQQRKEREAFEETQRKLRKEFEEQQRNLDIEVQRLKEESEGEIRRLNREAKQDEIELERNFKDDERTRQAEFNRDEREKDFENARAIERLKASQSNELPVEAVTARKHGGSVLPGQTYLAGEAGPELLKIGGMESLITKPSLMKFDQPGRIYSAPQTKRRLNSSAVKRDSVTTQVAQLNKMMRQIMTSPRGTVQTDVHIEGMQPDAIRRQLAMHQIDLYRGLGGI